MCTPTTWARRGSAQTRVVAPPAPAIMSRSARCSPVRRARCPPTIVLHVTPKQFCRFARFHALVRHVFLNPQVDWATAAAELGYYDQAHLIAEFKEFTGLTPSQFFRPPGDRPALAAD